MAIPKCAIREVNECGRQSQEHVDSRHRKEMKSILVEQRRTCEARETGQQKQTGAPPRTVSSPMLGIKHNDCYRETCKAVNSEDRTSDTVFLGKPRSIHSAHHCHEHDRSSD